MTAFTPPRGWRGMGFTAKAGWLCASGHARDYSEACSMLAKRRGKSVAPVLDAKARAKLWYLNES